MICFGKNKRSRAKRKLSPQTSVKLINSAAGKKAVPSQARSFKILLNVKAQFDEPFEQLLGGHPDKISQHQFLCIQPADIAQLKGFVASRVNEIAMTAVDHD